MNMINVIYCILVANSLKRIREDVDEPIERRGNIVLNVCVQSQTCIFFLISICSLIYFLPLTVYDYCILMIIIIISRTLLSSLICRIHSNIVQLGTRGNYFVSRS